MGAAGQGGGYEIDQSIRFNFSDAAHLLRTPSTASNRRTWTWSLWVKRSGLGNPGGPNQVHQLFGVGSGSCLRFTSTDQLRLETPAGNHTFVTSQVFRDTSAWYHIVLAFDSTQATDTNRRKLYVNGSQVTDFSSTTFTGLAQNAEWDINSTSQHQIAKSNLADYFGGYLAELNFIDGTALAATDFGETNDDGVWIPKEYTGSYGTNGFYITGADSTALGADVRISGDQVISYAASQYTGATGSYTYSNGSLEADSANKAIKTVDTFAGDFEFSWRYVNMANFVIGVYETGEDGTFSDSSSAGNMQNMTDSWYIQTSSVAANRDIFYGGAVQVNATTIANGDTWKMTRSSGTIKLIRNGSDVHTFSQTSTNTVRIVVAQGDAAADAEQVAWVDNSTLGNNFFSTGMTTADQMLDTPTKNWCTWNNNDTSFNNNVTSDGNLVITTASPGYTRFQLGTIGVSSGKWEWKWTPTASLSDGGIGVDDGTSQAATGASSGAFSSQSANGFIYRSNGQKLVGGSVSSYGATFAADDVIRCQIDLDADTPTIEFFKNDASQGSINMNAGVTYFPCQFSADAGLVTVADFGQSGFTAAAGFNTLNTASLAAPSITDGSAYFQPTIYTGNGSTLEVNQSGNSTFQPDWVWGKRRNGAESHALFDAVRGTTKIIYSNLTNAETTNSGLTAFDADGFTIGSSATLNTNTGTYVAWQWKANGSGSSNEDGSVNTTATSVNTTAGFSISKWTHTTSANYTVGHGLGAVPKMVIVKTLDQGTNWGVYHSGLAVGKRLLLNGTGAEITGYWGANTWNSTVFSIGSGRDANGSTMVGYAFAEIPGYSSFGSYTGNGSTDGPFVYTGFEPAFVMYKRINAAESWEMYDTTRLTYNPYNANLKANLSNAETNDLRLDILSNGFKARSSNTAINASGSTYIYMAFAENPFGGDGVAPATAR